MLSTALIIYTWLSNWKCDSFQKVVQILSVGLLGAEDPLGGLERLLVAPAHVVSQVLLSLDPLQTLRQVSDQQEMLDQSDCEIALNLQL